MTTSAIPTTTTAPAGTADDVVTRRLLRCGLAAGPVFLGVAAAQILTRNGFDLTRHPISLLANGDLGWIQIANFVLTGSFVIAFAAGLGRALNAQKGGTWGPRLLTIFGAGLVRGRLMPKGIRLSFMLIDTTPQQALRAAVDAITSALVDRALRPLPTTVFPLEEIAAAHEASERGITGKVLVDTR